MARETTTEHPAEYRPDELVVALPHERPVLALLEKARSGKTRAPEVDRDEVLGLARIRFDAHETVQGLSSVDGYAEAVARLDARRPRTDVHSALDESLRGLRAVLAAEFSGWTPTMGKNRLVASVEGAGRISGGAGTAPVRARRRPRLPLPTRAGNGVRVGVLDTGLSPRSGLAGCYARYSDLLSPDEDVFGPAGHATFAAGLVLSQAPGATVEVRRALDEDATGDVWTAAREIVEFGRDGVDVLNLSFLCFTQDDEPPLALAAAVDRLDPAIVVVAAAGNHGGGEHVAPGRPAWPAALDDVVAVGAIGASGQDASFSPPADLPWIDVRACGVDLVSTLGGGVMADGSTQDAGFAQWSGTSFAAALVSGAIAAATDPGRVPARAAWDDMRGSLPVAPPQPVLRLLVP